MSGGESCRRQKARTDPQGNLTAALGYTPAERSRTLANLLPVAIEYSIKVAECPAVGQSIFEYAPKNVAAKSDSNLADEVLPLG